MRIPDKAWAHIARALAKLAYDESAATKVKALNHSLHMFRVCEDTQGDVSDLQLGLGGLLNSELDFDSDELTVEAARYRYQMAAGYTIAIQALTL